MDVGGDEHLPVGFERPALGQVDETAGVVDAQRGSRPLDDDDVRVGPGQDPAADVAPATATVRTQKGGGEAAGGRAGSRPGRPDEEVGVHRPAGRGPERGHRGRLADDLGEELGDRPVRLGLPGHSARAARATGAGHAGSPSRSATTSAIVPATTSGGGVPSTTAHRVGSS